MSEKYKMINDPSFNCERADNVEEWLKIGREMIERKFPLQLDMELTTGCNLKCPFCVQGSDNPPKVVHMSFDLVNQMLLEGYENSLKSVKLQYRGEPLVYPQFKELIKLTKDSGIEVRFNTNGQLLNRDLAEVLISCGVHKVIFSVDSCIPSKYEKLRKGGKFITLLTNLMNLQLLKEREKSDKPLVRIQAVKQELNKVEIENNIYQDYFKVYADEIGIEDEFDFYDNKQDYTPLPKWHCEQLWQRLFVLADGTVIPCCAGIDYKEDKIYSVGNANTQSISEIWNSQKLRVMREVHRAGNSHAFEMCRKCRIRKYVVKKTND